MRELEVHLRWSPTATRRVGTLVEEGRQVWFEYAPYFLDNPVPLSPHALPVRVGLIAHTSKPGVPIPGVFGDARPDGWGLRLLHRVFQRAGRATVSPLEELAYLGSNTMGALIYRPATGPSNALDDAVELGALADHARAVYDGAAVEVLPALVRAGGSPGGVRPKALVGLDGQGNVRLGEGDLPEGWLHWLVKFPRTEDDPDTVRREWVWMEMARAAGLVVPEVRVLDLGAAGEAFATRRFDRPGGNRRVHLLSAAGALDVDFRTAIVDYLDLGRLTAVLCANDQAQLLALFRLAVFNIASVNEDDHLKNLAWTVDSTGVCTLSPAYDLTYAPHSSGHRSTPICGADHGITRHHLLLLGERLGLKRARVHRVIDEVLTAAGTVTARLEDSGCIDAVSIHAGHAVQQAVARLI